MEGIALTGAWVDKERGLLSLIALELGVSSRLVAHLLWHQQIKFLFAVAFLKWHLQWQWPEKYVRRCRRLR